MPYPYTDDRDEDALDRRLHRHVGRHDPEQYADDHDHETQRQETHGAPPGFVGTSSGGGACTSAARVLLRDERRNAGGVKLPSAAPPSAAANMS